MVLEVFFIESKLFQLVVEEGGNFFFLKIFEQGKYYMQSDFMGKSVAFWLMRNLKHDKCNFYMIFIILLFIKIVSFPLFLLI